MPRMPSMLRGERVALRPVEKTDLPAFTAWYSRYELQRLLTPGAIRLVNQDAEEAWFRSVHADGGTWMFAIDALDDPHAPEGRLIGGCSLLNVNGKNRAATLGISVADPAMQGRGYGGEALELLLEWGFLELNLNRIQLFVFAFNERARRLYAKTGFEEEGVLREAIYRDGRYWDEIVMGLLRAEWSPRRTIDHVGQEQRT